MCVCVYVCEERPRQRLYSVPTIAFMLTYSCVSHPIPFHPIPSQTLQLLLRTIPLSVLLGYLKEFDSSMTGAWSSGTGMAGVGGSLFYIAVYSGIGLSNQAVFLILLPTVLVYWITFKYISRPSLLLQAHVNAAGSPSSQSSGTDDATASLLHPSHQKNVDIDYSDDSDSLELESAVAEQTSFSPESAWDRTLRVLKHVFSPALQLGLVYFFEYVVSVGCAAIANPHPKEGDWFHENAFELLAFCYQLGVLMSRSSISFIQIKRIEWLTVLQGINFGLWMLHSAYDFLPLWLQFILMVYVGLLGGAMYVNVFFLLVEEDYEASDKELGINITALFINLGIVFAAIFNIVMDKTFFADEVKASDN
jgi:battenin